MECTKQRTVVKVIINCQICKTESLKAVTKLTGIDMVVVHGEKGTLTVDGVVDPFLVVKQLRKVRKIAEIISVGPIPPPPRAPSSQPTTASSSQPACGANSFDLPPCCKQCELLGYGLFFDDGRVSCQIL